MIENLQKYQPQINQISKTGPSENDYPLLINFFNEIASNRNDLNNADIMEMRTWFLGAMDDERTLQGHVCKKPRGYDGDYTIIDKIYNYHIAHDEVLSKWDIFFHKGDAPQAVRNRKTYFKNILSNLSNNNSVLNLASGSCRDLHEFGLENTKQLLIDCIDLDADSLEFGKNLLSNIDTLQTDFIHTNIFKFMPTKKYNLIWSAGLFDYVEDKYFTALIERFAAFVEPNGEIIIGNFNTTNNSKADMEFGNWFLHHRSIDDLLNLVKNITCKEVIVEAEPLNVNLFLRLKF